MFGTFVKQQLTSKFKFPAMFFQESILDPPVNEVDAHVYSTCLVPQCSALKIYRVY